MRALAGQLLTQHSEGKIRPHRAAGFPDAIGGPRKALFGVALRRCSTMPEALLRASYAVYGASWSGGAAPPVKPGLARSGAVGDAAQPGYSRSGVVSNGWSRPSPGKPYRHADGRERFGYGRFGYPQTCPP
jgi:hypothetical protein